MFRVIVLRLNFLNKFLKFLNICGNENMIMHSKYIVLIGILVITAVHAEDKNKKKRQIYREEVLPHAGGRIPDTAFQTDRLFLNRLQKDGIAVPDGVVPEQRNPQVYPFLNKPMREVYRVALSSDARYIPSEGRYHYSTVPSVETTYLYPQIQGQITEMSDKTPMYPIYKQLQLPNPLLNQLKLQPKKKAPLLTSMTSFRGMKNNFKTFKPHSYQNFNILNSPVAPTINTIGYHYYPDYESAHLFSDFDNFFNNLDFHAAAASRYKNFNKYPVQHIKY